LKFVQVVIYNGDVQRRAEIIFVFFTEVLKINMY